MKKKVLMTATVPSMIGQFNMENIKILLSMGYEVHVACNFKDRSVWTEEKVRQLEEQLTELQVKKVQIEYVRTPYDIGKLLKAYSELKSLIRKEKYVLLHCHTPVAGLISRLAVKDAGTITKVIYTAHGFHFYKGAPLLNWIFYYPIEKWMSRYTDILITINKEDYRRAKKEFRANRTEYIPGVGVDVEKLNNVKINKKEKRKALRIPENAFVLISVGELSERKNQIIVIHALARIKNNNIFYLIVGEGGLQHKYERLIRKSNLEKNILLMGYREDIGELCKISDCFVHPSIREGLGIAPLEGMACGLPLIASYVNGIKDYSIDNITGICVSPNSVKEMEQAINKMYIDLEFRERCGRYNRIAVKKFDLLNSNKKMKKIYSSLF